MRAHGSVALAADGSFTYTPDADYHGPDSFTYRAFDGAAYSLPAIVTIDVASVNDPPVAIPDSRTTDQQTAVTIDVLTNDNDDGAFDLASAACLTNCTHVVDNGDGTFTYTPPAGLYTSATFTYQVADDGGLISNVALVTIQINPDSPAHRSRPQSRTREWSAIGLNSWSGSSMMARERAYDVQIDDEDVGSCFDLRAADDPDLGNIAEGNQRWLAAVVRIVDDTDCDNTHTVTADAANASPVSSTVEVTILPSGMGFAAMAAPLSALDESSI